MSLLINKMEINRAKEKFKKTAFWEGGFYAVSETYYVYK
jgi:hypothetical protein